ncbi:Glycosyltransferase involved in cell wall bisynthesis [Jannaschia faecimaris]|uniref:Glycosyltransferase involved in cell wall bisynthesis n=2 Tax=Jannaschia faecimaris TaxID=1244108 RepID=A0A1H3JCZ1_9RHOB|nr:Glycosyltransferase involved in cell wall bisynthesis [Jannaschia faecimaris]
MIVDRVVAPQRIHHLHIAGRGSTARKLILGWLARRLGCAHVLHLHDFDYAQDFRRRPPSHQRLIRDLFQKADRVITLGRRDAGTVVDLLGVPQARVDILHNAVPDPIRGAIKAFPDTGKDVGIVFLGQLGERKGVPELLKALAHPSMEALRWRAVLAGDGPVDLYRAKAAELGLTNRVTMPGWLSADDARDLCRDSDILVLPSHGEGMAMAVLEGLAQGLAVVTTPVGAHEEILTDDVNCAFVPVGDPVALAHALADLVTQPERRNRLAGSGRAYYLRALSMEAYMSRLDAVLASVRPGRLAVPEGRGRSA